MRRFLIDTTPLSVLLTNRPEIVSLITPWMRAREAATSILVYGEVLEGLMGRANYLQRHAELLALLGAITPYVVTRDHAALR